MQESASGNLPIVPDEPIPNERVWRNNPIRVHNYGMSCWGDLFSARQAFALSTLIRRLHNVTGGDQLGAATRRALTLTISRQADYLSTLSSWDNSRENVSHTFGRQALAMVWDFAEANPFSGRSGGFDGAIEWVAEVAEQIPAQIEPGQVTMADAARSGLPSDAADAMFTDPPYYDAVPYAKLANYFYVWQRRALGGLHPDLFAADRIDGVNECVVDEARGQDRAYFKDLGFKCIDEAIHHLPLLRFLMLAIRLLMLATAGSAGSRWFPLRAPVKGKSNAG
jgi:adenine-specific DNA methylase